ncbi:MAG: acylphosphatase [Roseobacter sp.]
MVGIELKLTGDLKTQNLIPWICHRAGVLDLKGWVKRHSGSSVEIAVFGPEPLLDAMEVACFLGPCDAFVTSLQKRELTIGAIPNDFSTT